MNKVHKNINNVLTPLILWGDPLTNSENVIICITGNPGVSDFYIDFGSELYKQLSIPVCIIGHAGHEESLNKKSKHLFDLKDQVEHKIDLIENHINQNSKIHLIGHSIGAWMILELLQRRQHLISRVSSVNLLCPTIQKMAETRNGIVVNGILRKLYKMALFLATVLYYVIPKYVLYCIIGIYLWLKGEPVKFTPCITKMLNPDILSNIMTLAFNEMDTVKSLNVKSLNEVKHLTHVVYAVSDKWVPLEYIEDLAQFTPELQITEAGHYVQHAFVLRSSEEVAELVAHFIKNKLGD